MTDREKAVVMAYTGCVMLTGDKLKVFYDYVSEIIGRPVYTHELPLLLDTIKEAAFPDFCTICKTESEPLEQRIRELEKRLSDVESSPFGGGMSQKEYFGGERHAVWLFTDRKAERNFFKCSECGCVIFTKGDEPNFPECPECHVAMIGGVSDG